MGYLGRRIGNSPNTGKDTGTGVGGGLYDLFAAGYFQRQGNMPNAPGILPITGLTATGGVISDYSTPPGAVYRTHIFTSSGTFTVSALAVNLPNSVEYLVVGGGGGGGGGWYAGGGGAGGLRTNLPSVIDSNANPLSISSSYPVSTSPGSYSVTIGSGGVGSNSTQVRGTDGGFSQFGPPTGTFVYGSGGGGGGSRGTPVNPGNPGGSGGGAGQYGSGEAPGGTSVASPDGLTPTTQGKAGGTNPISSYGAGGGGAGAVGNTGGTINPTYGASGGGGVQVLIAGPPATTQPVGTPGPNPGGGYFGGGGGAGSATNTSYTGGFGGGGKGAINSPSTASVSGTYATGGGGGGATGFETPSTSSSPLQVGANGGSGIVVVRYQIAQLTATAKATGGAISFYSGKTIHTFTTSGDFNVTTGPLSVEYVVIGGGAGGSSGGGGAGGYRTATGFTVNPGPNPVTVGAGGNRATSGRDTRGGDGNQSIFSTITSEGGGAGGAYGDGGVSVRTGNPGGSGGGGGGLYTAQTATAGGDGDRVAGTSTPVPAQGNRGGASSPGINGGAGGGGGAGGVGGDGTNPAAGPGGVGVQIPTTFRNPIVAPSDTTTPQPYQRGGGLGTPGPGGSYYVAGGGGGAAVIGSSPGAGGAGGGGMGGQYQPFISSTDGLTNTGGGGGGGSSDPQNVTGAGGSGIVLIAYPS